VSRKVLVKHSDGSSFDLTQTPAPNEHHLQEVMKEHPSLLPVDDLGISGPLAVVGRETALASGSIDLVGVVPSGDVVLVEFKTGPQNPDFRHALAQLIDYGSDLWGSSITQFDDGVVQRYLTSPRCPAEYKTVQNLQELVKVEWQSEEFDWESFAQRLADVLEEGDFHYVVAAQRFTPPMTRSLDYLNKVVGVGKYHLVQMTYLTGEAVTAYSAQAVGSPSKLRRPLATAGTTQTSFLADIDDEAYREALEDIFAACSALGLSFEWGSRGTSIRLATADRSEPLSVGWALPEGHHWYGLRYLSLGYDTASAKHTPSVAVALDAYAAKLADINGGLAAKGKTLRAWTWQPSQVPGAKDALIEALESLVQDAGGNEPSDDTTSSGM
jgi:hypothetical protein